VSETTTRTEFEGSQGKLAAALELPSGAPRAFALFAHCFSCSKDIKAARDIARALRAQGFAVLRFDFTGLGASEGDFANTNFSSNVEDLVRAADFLRREFEAPSIIIGHSLGGAAAIVAATAIPEAKGVAVIAAPAEAAHVLAHIEEARAEIEEKGEAHVELSGRPFTIRKQFIEDLEQARVTEAAAALRKPLLILHSPLDQVVGIENAAKIFAAAKHPKSFVSLDHADHLLRNTEDGQYAATIIAAWAGRYIDAVPAQPAAHAGGAGEEFRGGARAVSIADKRFAVALSIDGYPFVIDADREDGGDGLGPNPTRTVEGALAACAAITMRMYAERKKWPLAKVSVAVRRAAGEDAHAATMLEKLVSIDGDLDQAQRDRIKEIGDRCPVHRLLSAGVKIGSHYA
jgi:putative redox protein